MLSCGCTRSTDRTDQREDRPADLDRPAATAISPVPRLETTIRFTDVAQAAGIDWTVRNGEEAGQLSILETLGAGCAIADYDRDGQLDVFLMGGGRYASEREVSPLPMALFRQLEPWRFIAVQEPAGLPTPRYYHHGAFTADVNNDGFPDLLITGYGGLQMFHNQGDGTFEDVTAKSGLADTLWSTAAAWADLDKDGVLDLFVGHYVDWSFDNHPACLSPVGSRKTVCPPTRFAGQTCSVYLARGDGTYRDASHALGVDLIGKTLGAVIADLDDDGYEEIYVANDTDPNQLYQRQPNGHYQDVALVSGVALGDTGESDGSMGVDVGDLDGDGRLDLWVANFEDQSFALYRNLGNHLFAHTSRAWGIAAVGRLAVGFGTVIFDADGDGDPDIYCANGHIRVGTSIELQQQQPFLFVNQAGVRFENLASQAGVYLREPHVGRGVACADLDQNGSLDLIITHSNAPAAVLRNDTPIANWLAVRLVGHHCCRDAIGARVIVQCGPKQQVMVIKGGGSYLSTSDQTLWFGLGTNTIADRIEVHWPHGSKQVIEGIQSNKRLLLIEDHSN